MLLLLGAGCAGRTAAYRPALATSTTTSGHQATYYEITKDKTTLGTVKVWSQGGYQMQTPTGKQSVVDLHLRIRNDSDAPITLDMSRTDLEVVTSDGAVTVVHQPLETTGAESVAPQSLERIGLIYPLPPHVDPGSVTGLDLSWTLGTAKGAFSESTPFVQRSRYGERYLYWPYYGAYWGPGWVGPGWGGYWGPGWGGYWGPGWGGYEEPYPYQGRHHEEEEGERGEHEEHRR